MAKSATGPGVMYTLAELVELTTHKNSQLMVAIGNDNTIEKFSMKGAVILKCGTYKQNHFVKFNFN